MTARFRSWDDYYIPGTIVLRNKFVTPDMPYGQTDQAILTRLEEAASFQRLVELARDPIQGRFDYAHFKAIHRFVFQDVYEWAGQERVGPVGGFMSKDGHAYYGAGPHLTTDAHKQFEVLRNRKLLRDLPRAQFVIGLAEIWGELNVIHSFREGNTRTQFVFFSQLAEQAGWQLDSTRFAPGQPLRNEFVAARFHSQDSGDNTSLATVLDQGITATEK